MMNSYLNAIDLKMPANTDAGKIRERVLSEMPWAPTPTSMVSYVSSNRVLIIAEQALALELQSKLPEKIQTYLALLKEQSCASTITNAWEVAQIHVRGYLGRFEASTDSDVLEESIPEENNLGLLFNIANGLFDQVIDCSEVALIRAAIKPPGYYHFSKDSQQADQILSEVAQLIGEFDKPRYFNYDESICAHGRSGIKGCTRCLDACPTQAIISVEDKVQVNPYLCQGGGSCASSCPTGAITYTYPKAEEQIELLRLLLKSIRQQNDNRSVSLLIYDNEHGVEQVKNQIDVLPEHIIPFMVEDIGSVGLDLLSSACAYGAGEIILYLPETLTPQVDEVMRTNVNILQTLSEALKLESYRLAMIQDLSLLGGVSEQQGHIDTVATYSPIGNKRNIIRSAFHYLNAIANEESDCVSLPANALFGQVVLNSDACTLCMACVSVCPAKALQDGGDVPALKFVEANCVQCGICSQACPESAIVLEPRIHFEHNLIHSPRVLKQEEPFRCLDCGKAFASHSMIQTMTAKLQGHWMFENPEALRRLKLCEDCRVADMFEKGDIQ